MNSQGTKATLVEELSNEGDLNLRQLSLFVFPPPFNSIFRFSDQSIRAPAIRARRAESETQSPFLSHVLGELNTLRKHVSKDNWDNEGALPLNTHVFKHAETFVRSLNASEISYPEVDASPQGEIVFSWDSEDYRNIFDVLITPTGRLAFSGMFDKSTLTGNFELDDLSIELIINIVRCIKYGSTRR